MTIPIEFDPNNMFYSEKHIVDDIAKQYLERATANVRHLIPVKIDNDDCLYSSIGLLMNNPTITSKEIRGMMRLLSIIKEIEINK